MAMEVDLNAFWIRFGKWTVTVKMSDFDHLEKTESYIGDNSGF